MNHKKRQQRDRRLRKIRAWKELKTLYQNAGLLDMWCRGVKSDGLSNILSDEERYIADNWLEYLKSTMSEVK